MSHRCVFLFCVRHLVAITETFRLLWFKLHWMLLKGLCVNVSGLCFRNGVNALQCESENKCLLQKQFSVYCISDQHVCMTHRLWQQPHRHTPLQVVHNNKGTPRIGCSQLARYNQMLRSKTACHAAIWHGEIWLDEIHFKVQGLAYTSIQSAINKYQERRRTEAWTLTHLQNNPAACFWRWLQLFGYLFFCQLEICIDSHNIYTYIYCIALIYSICLHSHWVNPS